MPDPNVPTPNASQPETVPKSDFERVKNQADESARNLDVLRSQLTDPDYIAYRESKNAPKPAAPATHTPLNLNNMTLEQLQGLIAEGVSLSVKQIVSPLYARLDNVAAQQELDLVARKYEDFDTYRDQTANILKNTPNELTIEQAYLMAKASTPAAPAEGTPATPAAPKTPAGNERPSSNVPVDGDSLKKFKNPQEAGNAAWQSIAEKYQLSGDTI